MFILTDLMYSTSRTDSTMDDENKRAEEKRRQLEEESHGISTTIFDKHNWVF